MMEAHIAALLPTQNRVLSADENTAFLAHYDLNEHDVLRNVKALGQTKALDCTDLPNGVSISNASHYTVTAITISMRIKPTSLSGTQTLFCKRMGSSNGIFLFNYTGNTIWFDFGGSNTRWDTGFVPATNKWTHIALTHTGTTAILYVDGQQYATVTRGDVSNINTSAPIELGGGQGYPYLGSIYDVQYYQKALTAEQVKWIYETGEKIESGLVGCWKLNEGEGNIARDFSPFHNDGTISGTPKWVEGNSVFTLRQREGYFGGNALAIEEGTTNLLYKAGATNLSNRIPESGRYTTTYLGNGKYKIENISSTLQANIRLYCNLSDLVNGATYTSSVYYEEANMDFTIDFCDAGVVTCLKGNGRGATTVTRSTYDSTFRFFDILLPIGGSIILWGDQVEQKSFATSFINGTRTNGILEYPQKAFPIETSGTFSCWAKTHTGGVEKNIFFQWDTGGNTGGHFGLKMGTDGKITFSYGVQNLISPNSYNDGNWHFYSITWVNGTNNVHLYVDGSLVASASSAVTVTNIGGRKEARVPIGHRGWTYKNVWWNGLIDEIRIDNVARTAEEISAWYYCNSPFWPRGIYRKSY